jgi:hypothetical protein
MPGNGDTDMLMQMVLEECDLLDERLSAVEAEMLSREDNAPSAEPVPVHGAQSAAEIEQALEEGM